MIHDPNVRARVPDAPGEHGRSKVAENRYQAALSVVRRLLDGDVPNGDRWYGVDETGNPIGKGYPITDREKEVLDDA